MPGPLFNCIALMLKNNQVEPDFLKCKIQFLPQIFPDMQSCQNSPYYFLHWWQAIAFKWYDGSGFCDALVLGLPYKL